MKTYMSIEEGIKCLERVITSDIISEELKNSLEELHHILSSLEDGLFIFGGDISEISYLYSAFRTDLPEYPEIRKKQLKIAEKYSLIKDPVKYGDVINRNDDTEFY